MLHSQRAYRLRLLPLVLPVGLLFATGAAVSIAQSLSYMVPFASAREALQEQGRFWAWKQLVTDTWIWQSVSWSIAVSLVGSVVSVAAGSVLAWNIYRLPGLFRRFAEIYRIPLILPHLTIAFLALLLLGRSGILSSLAARMGLTRSMDQFPNILFGVNGLGLILAYTFKETPFVILMTMGQLRKLDVSTVECARMLGASRFGVFRDIVLPHIRPILASTFIILFLYQLGAFEIPWLIGTTKRQMLGVTAYNLYFQRDLSLRPVASALLTIMMLMSVLFILVSIRMSKRRTGHA